MSFANIRAAILAVATAWLPAKVVALVAALLDIALTDSPLNLGVAPDALKTPLLRLIRDSISKMPNPIARRVLILVFDRVGEQIIDAAWDKLFPAEGGPRMGDAHPAFDVETISAFDEVENHVGNLLAA